MHTAPDKLQKNIFQHIPEWCNGSENPPQPSSVHLSAQAAKDRQKNPKKKKKKKRNKRKKKKQKKTKWIGNFKLSRHVQTKTAVLKETDKNRHEPVKQTSISFYAIHSTVKSDDKAYVLKDQVRLSYLRDAFLSRSYRTLHDCKAARRKDVEILLWKREDKEKSEREKRVARARIEPMAAAPSQPESPSRCYKILLFELDRSCVLGWTFFSRAFFVARSYWTSLGRIDFPYKKSPTAKAWSSNARTKLSDTQTNTRTHTHEHTHRQINITAGFSNFALTETEESSTARTKAADCILAERMVSVRPSLNCRVLELSWVCTVSPWRLDRQKEEDNGALAFWNCVTKNLKN